jgi:short subunit dehydrogenase-like uncharacterized protein
MTAGENFLIYGSYGYTGRLVAKEAAKRGLRPILAGRDEGKLGHQAAELGLEYLDFSLAQGKLIDKALEGMNAVVHCAGPFSHTYRPMIESCLRTGTHYLDITGEISVYQALADCDQQAKEAGIMILPGAGFDVVPTDCLAAHLKRRLPTASSLTLAFQAIGRPSRGTANSGIENLHLGGVTRRGGKLVKVPAGWKTRYADFGRGPVRVISIPWGDVFTAYYSTGIPNIEDYMAVPAGLQALMRLSRYFGWLLKLKSVQWVAKGIVRSMPEGLSEAQRLRGLSLIWGEVKDDAGNRRVSRMSTPEAYTLTSLTAVSAVEKVLAGKALPGFQTPSLAFGADFMLEIQGVIREDLV